MFKSLKSASTSLILLGVLAVVVGIIAIAWPGVTILALVIMFAVYAFMDAGLQAARAFSSRSAGPVFGHLLLALIDDEDASAVMEVCKVEIGSLKEDLVSYIDAELKALVITDGRGSRPTPGFQRVVERAALNAQIQGRDPTGADLLVFIFDERESHAAWFLINQDMTQEDAANSTLQAIVSRGPRSSPRSS